MKQLIIIAMLISSISMAQTTEGQDIVVNMTNFDNDDGKVLVGLFDSENAFLNKRLKGDIATIENKKSTVVFKNVPPGIYAISVFHDENNNDKLDTNFFGIPKEDTGCSNNAPARFGPPKWKDAKFEVTNPLYKTLNFKHIIMKRLLIIATFFMAFTSSAQNNYEKGMNKAFALWGEGKPTEAANLFERIATAEPDNWLPPYWAAQINIISSFGEKDKDKLTAQLGKAQDLLNDATAISKDNPEIMVMQAMLHTAWVAYDGATYGMTLSGKVIELYTKAQLIAPDNPRVVLNRAEWDMGGAKFFGQDTEPFCKDVERSLALFAKFKPESQFHPKWGEDRAKQILADCE